MGLFMNEDIFLEDTGINLRSTKLQECMERIQELELLNERYADEVRRTNE